MAVEELLKSALAGVEGVQMGRLTEVGRLLDAMLTFEGPAGHQDYSSPPTNAITGLFLEGTTTIAPAGQLIQGIGSLDGGNFTGLRIWRSGDVGRLTTYKNGVVQIDLNTNGQLTAGGGNVVLDQNGIRILVSDVPLSTRAYAFKDSTDTTLVGEHVHSLGVTANVGEIDVFATSGRRSQLLLQAAALTGFEADVTIAVQSGTQVGQARLVYTDTGSKVFKWSDAAFSPAIRMQLDYATGTLELATTGSGAGLLLGGDFRIYRSATNVGRTPHTFQIDTALRVGATAVGSVAGAIYTADPGFTFAQHWADSDATGAEKRAWTNWGQSGTSSAPARSWAMGIDNSGDLIISTRTSAWADPADTASGRFPAAGGFVVAGNLGVGGPSINNSGIAIGKTVVTFLMDETDASANNRLWELFVNGEQLIIRVVNDAYTVAGNWCVVDRTGTTIDSVKFENAGYLMRTLSALTNGAGANTATLTNAPAAGNPTKWVPIDDFGTTRYIPTW